MIFKTTCYSFWREPRVLHRPKNQTGQRLTNKPHQDNVMKLNGYLHQVLSKERNTYQGQDMFCHMLMYGLFVGLFRKKTCTLQYSIIAVS